MIDYDEFSPTLGLISDVLKDFKKQQQLSSFLNKRDEICVI